MSYLFIASAGEGELAYIFVVPLLVLILSLGIVLTASRAKLWANIPGGILLLYACVEFGANPRSPIGISAAVPAAISACIFAWWSSKSGPQWIVDRGIHQLGNRLLALMFSFSIQFLVAGAIGGLVYITLRQS